ncbi:hypothetical protein PCE1_004121 [Barthelona sp. PCE]
MFDDPQFIIRDLKLEIKEKDERLVQLRTKIRQLLTQQEVAVFTGANVALEDFLIARGRKEVAIVQTDPLILNRKSMEDSKKKAETISELKKELSDVLLISKEQEQELRRQRFEFDKHIVALRKNAEQIFVEEQNKSRKEVYLLSEENKELKLQVQSLQKHLSSPSRMSYTSLPETTPSTIVEDFTAISSDEEMISNSNSPSTTLGELNTVLNDNVQSMASNLFAVPEKPKPRLTRNVRRNSRGGGTLKPLMMAEKPPSPAVITEEDVTTSGNIRIPVLSVVDRELDRVPSFEVVTPLKTDVDYPPSDLLLDSHSPDFIGSSAFEVLPSPTGTELSYDSSISRYLNRSRMSSPRGSSRVGRIITKDKGVQKNLKGLLFNKKRSQRHKRFQRKRKRKGDAVKVDKALVAQIDYFRSQEKSIVSKRSMLLWAYMVRAYKLYEFSEELRAQYAYDPNDTLKRHIEIVEEKEASLRNDYLTKIEILQLKQQRIFEKTFGSREQKIKLHTKLTPMLLTKKDPESPKTDLPPEDEDDVDDPIVVPKTQQEAAEPIDTFSDCESTIEGTRLHLLDLTDNIWAPGASTVRERSESALDKHDFFPLKTYRDKGLVEKIDDRVLHTVQFGDEYEEIPQHPLTSTDLVPNAILRLNLTEGKKRFRRKSKVAKEHVVQIHELEERINDINKMKRIFFDGEVVERESVLPKINIQNSGSMFVDGHVKLLSPRQKPRKLVAPGLKFTIPDRNNGAGIQVKITDRQGDHINFF